MLKAYKRKLNLSKLSRGELEFDFDILHVRKIHNYTKGLKRNNTIEYKNKTSYIYTKKLVKDKWTNKFLAKKKKMWTNN